MEQTTVNPTIAKFGHPATLVHEYEHWVVLLRPAQVTLGSLVLAAKSDAEAFAELPAEAFVEMRLAVIAIERGLAAFRAFDRLNYLMLMMVDRNVHFHVIPRYAEAQHWDGRAFVDAGWPGPPELGSAVQLDEAQISALTSQLAAFFH